MQALPVPWKRRDMKEGFFSSEATVVNMFLDAPVPVSMEARGGGRQHHTGRQREVIVFGVINLNSGQSVTISVYLFSNLTK